MQILVPLLSPICAPSLSHKWWDYLLSLPQWLRRAISATNSLLFLGVHRTRDSKFREWSSTERIRCSPGFNICSPSAVHRYHFARAPPFRVHGLSGGISGGRGDMSVAMSTHLPLPLHSSMAGVATLVSHLPLRDAPPWPGWAKIAAGWVYIRPERKSLVSYFSFTGTLQSIWFIWIVLLFIGATGSSFALAGLKRPSNSPKVASLMWLIPKTDINFYNTYILV